MWDSFIDLFGHSYVSSAGAMLLLVAAISFVPSRVSRKKRMIIGILHVSAHLAAALILMLLLELGVETCIRHDLLGTAGEIFLSYLYFIFHMVWQLCKFSQQVNFVFFFCIIFSIEFFAR